MAFVFTCSVDDGHPMDQRMADLLARYDLEATFYCPIHNIEGLPVMTGAQMRAIGQRFEIGSHTQDHCFLNQLRDANAAFQINRGKRILEDTLGYRVDGFCYPGGAYQRRHIEMVQDAGFQYARTTQNLQLGMGADRFQIATTCQFYPHDRSVYLRNFLRGGQWHARLPGLMLAIQNMDWRRRLYCLFDAAQSCDGVFHLWLHSHDVERFSAWQILESFLAYVATCASPEARLTNGALVQRTFPARNSE